MVVAIVVVMAAAACDTTGPVTCTSEPLPAVVVEVFDSVTGDPLAEEARGIVVDGEYQDSLVAYEGMDGLLFSRGAAYDRAGTYSVFVAHPEYQLWSTTGVRARLDNCHARSQRVRANMVLPDP